MASIGFFEAKTQLRQLPQRAERGEEISITRRGQAVARLVPVAARPDARAALAAFRHLRERARRSGLGKSDWAEWRTYRDEGLKG